MSRRNTGRTSAEANRRRKAQERRSQVSQSSSRISIQPESPTEPQIKLWDASRAGARAGRGFRYQDLIGTLIALRLWSEGEATALVTPEGYDDISVDSKEGLHFVQVKSRRESAGDFPVAQLRKDLRSVAKSWIKRRDAGLSTATTLLLERSITRIPVTEWANGTAMKESIAGLELSHELLSIDLGDDRITANFAASVSVVTCPNPQAQAVDIVVGTLGVPESLAEIIVSAVCTQIGKASDANVDTDASNHVSMDIASIDVLVEQILTTVDLEMLDEARTLGICELINWGMAADGSDLRKGAHVGASHVASGLLVPRFDLMRQVIEIAEARRLAVVSGPSGSGKSALTYAAVHETRNLYRWQQVHSLLPVGRTGRDAAALIIARIESLRPSVYAPVGILIDDAGRHDPHLLDRLLRRLADLSNVVTIVSVREEDRFPVPLLSAVATITPMLDDIFAEELWRDYRSRSLTSWAGWREPTERAGGLLLEYVTLLTENDGLDTVVGSQIQSREADPSRHLELDILRLVSCANQFGVPVSVQTIRAAIGAEINAFTIANRRLIDEHLIVEDSGSMLRPLHELRSAALAKASHPFGQQETLLRLVELVSSADLSRFIRRVLETEADTSKTVQAAIGRVGRDHTIQTLIGVISAVRSDLLRRRADDWKGILDDNGIDAGNAVTAFMMSRTAPSPGAEDLSPPQMVSAISQLSDVPTEPDLKFLWSLIDMNLVEELLASAALNAETLLLLQAITVLRGVDAKALEATADAVGARLPAWPLREAANFVQALHRADPKLAERAVAIAGGETFLLRRIVVETPWLASLERSDVGVDGRWVFIDEDLQPDQNGAVVEACRLALALAPTAAIARISAVDALGRLTKIGEYPLVDKAIPRGNLPNALEVSDNRAQARALSKKYGSGTLTSKLADESKALGEIVTLLPKITLAHLGNQAVPKSVVREFNALTTQLAQMDAPAEESYQEEVPGALGDYPMESGAVTVIRLLLEHVIPNLVRADVAKRRPILTIGMLDGLIAKVNAMIELDRYRYLPHPPDCDALLECLRQLRSIASASASKDPSIRSSMRAAAARHTGTDQLVRAAAVAADRSSIALRKEASRMQLTLSELGFSVDVVPCLSDLEILSWPSGDLAITVEGKTVISHLSTIEALADAVRGAVEQPDRRVWIGLKTPEGYLRNSIFQVMHQGLLPLGNRQMPALFAGSVAETPISELYENFLRQARRLSSIITIMMIRGSKLIPDDEGSVFEESWKQLLIARKKVTGLTSDHLGTDFVSTLTNIMTVISEALSEDLSAAKVAIEEGRSGWQEVTNLQSLHILDAEQAGIEGTDASVVYYTGIVISAVEDRLEDADSRIADMQQGAAVGVEDS